MEKFWFSKQLQCVIHLKQEIFLFSTRRGVLRLNMKHTHATAIFHLFFGPKIPRPEEETKRGSLYVFILFHDWQFSKLVQHNDNAAEFHETFATESFFAVPVVVTNVLLLFCGVIFGNLPSPQSDNGQSMTSSERRQYSVPNLVWSFNHVYNRRCK